MRLPSSATAALIVFVILAPASERAGTSACDSGREARHRPLRNLVQRAAQPQFNRAVALLHSFEFGRAIDGFSATLDDGPVLRDGAVGHRAQPVEQSVRPGHPAGRRCCSRGARPSKRATDDRTEDRPRARLRRRGRRGCTPMSRRRIRPRASRRTATRWRSSRRPTRTTREASIFYALSIAAAASPTDKTFADQLKAGAILEKLYRRPAGSSRARALHHPQLRRAAAGRSRARGRAALRDDRAVGAARAAHAVAHVHARSATGRNRSTPTSRLATVAKRERSVAEELHAMDYRIYAYLQTAQDRSARQLLEALPEVAARFDPDAIGSAAPGSAGVFALAAIPARYALERGAWADAAKLEPHPEQVSRTPKRSRTSRARSAPPVPATPRPFAPRSRRLQRIQQQLTTAKEALLGRADRDPTARRDRRGSPSRNSARPTRSPKCAPPRRWKTARRSPRSRQDRWRPRANCSERCCCEIKRAGRGAEGIRGDAEERAKPLPRACTALHARHRSPATGSASRRYYGQLLKICTRADMPPGAPSWPRLVARSQAASKRAS